MRTYLVVIDDSPEASLALRFAARRAARTGGGVAVLAIIPPQDFVAFGGVQATIEAALLHAPDDGVVSVVGIIHDRRESSHLTALREALSDDFDVASLLETDDALSFRRPGIGTDVTRRLRRGKPHAATELPGRTPAVSSRGARDSPRAARPNVRKRSRGRNFRPRRPSNGVEDSLACRSAGPAPPHNLLPGLPLRPVS